MKIKFTNNWKVKRQFSNGLWLRKGPMFPFANYVQIGFFGFIIMIVYGDY